MGNGITHRLQEVWSHWQAKAGFVVTIIWLVIWFFIFQTPVADFGSDGDVMQLIADISARAWGFASNPFVHLGFLFLAVLLFWWAWKAAEKEIKQTEAERTKLLADQHDAISATVNNAVNERLGPYDKALSDMFRFQIASFKEPFLDKAVKEIEALKKDSYASAAQWIEVSERFRDDSMMLDKARETPWLAVRRDVVAEYADLLSIPAARLRPTADEIESAIAPHLDRIEGGEFRTAYLKFVASCTKVADALEDERRALVAFTESGKRVLLKFCRDD